MTEPNIIAIDGPAASGKSTLAIHLANWLDYLYFDTGIMYRTVTLAALRAGIDIENEAEITGLANRITIDVKSPTPGSGRTYDVTLDGLDVTDEIRTAAVDANVSPVSAYGGVRKAMTEKQRAIGSRGKVVMVGRDIGTVVFPEADLKLYLVASVEERARRRHQELLASGESPDYQKIAESMRKRDDIDSHRSIAPLKPADDAHIINTDHLSIEQVFEQVKALIR
ncbi:MAG: (d)CMP kinase [Anaerolineaceae bacterium]|nr:(d)CMP kinase [Anaerolineaceae bacterium]MBN2676437.1 (d)CMP kinase [Anaerolineaceae bacterium]